jgi:hypothetical protein
MDSDREKGFSRSTVEYQAPENVLICLSNENTFGIAPEIGVIT